MTEQIYIEFFNKQREIVEFFNISKTFIPLPTEKDIFKQNTETVLEFLKQHGHDRAKVEEKLGYSDNGIDQSLSRGGNLKLLRSVQLYKDWAVLKNSIQDNTQLIPDADLGIDELSEWLKKLQSAAAEVQKMIFDKISSGGIARALKPSSVSNKAQKSQTAQNEKSLGK